MSVKINDHDNMKKLYKQCEDLNGKSLRVGVFDDTPDSQMLVAVHEYGMTIKPKNGRYLAIPCNRKSKGKKPADFQDLFFMRTKEGHRFLCKNVGKDKFDFLFMLLEQVVIPERSFIRAGWNQNEKDFRKKAADMLAAAIMKGLDTDVVLQALGNEMKGYIQEYARDLKNPPNAPITTAVKRSTNPLVDTGQMIRDVTYKIE